MLRSITLRQPFAGAMALGLKRNETRGRRCKWRGDLCIHSGMRAIPWEDYPTPVKELGYPSPIEFWPGGAILCVVDLYDCVPTEYIERPSDFPLLLHRGLVELSPTERALGDYSRGRFALLTRNLRVLKRPVPCRGQQAVPWTVPPEVEAEVRRQLP